LANASAITGRLGNSRMVLHPDVGEEVERYLLIQNINDVLLTITLIPSGDLRDEVQLEETSLILQPGDEKKVYFTIKANEVGTTETKINVAFSPESGGAGVGLTATIIVVASEEGSGEDPGNEGGSEVEGDDDNPGFNFNPSQNAGNNGESETTVSPFNSLLISTIVLIVIFIVLLVYAKKSKTKKRARRPSA